MKIKSISSSNFTESELELLQSLEKEQSERNFWLNQWNKDFFPEPQPNNLKAKRMFLKQKYIDKQFCASGSTQPKSTRNTFHHDRFEGFGNGQSSMKPENSIQMDVYGTYQNLFTANAPECHDETLTNFQPLKSSRMTESFQPVPLTSSFSIPLPASKKQQDFFMEPVTVSKPKETTSTTAPDLLDLFGPIDTQEIKQQPMIFQQNASQVTLADDDFGEFESAPSLPVAFVPPPQANPQLFSTSTSLYAHPQPEGI